MINHNVIISYKLRTRIYSKSIVSSTTRIDLFLIKNQNTYSQLHNMFTPFVRVAREKEYKVLLK